jgi:hypothetical protein
VTIALDDTIRTPERSTDMPDGIYLTNEQTTRMIQGQNGRGVNMPVLRALIEVGAIRRMTFMGKNGWETHPVGGVAS